MRYEVRESDLIKYVGGSLTSLDADTYQLIARGRKCVGSPVWKWFQEFDTKCREPLNIDWLTVSIPNEATELATSGRKSLDSVNRMSTTVNQLLDLGNYEAAVDVARHLEKLGLEVLGPDDLQMTDIWRCCGYALTLGGEVSDAILMLERALALVDREPFDSLALVRVLDQLAFAYCLFESPEKADACARRAVQISTDKFGSEAKESASPLSTLGLACFYLEKHEEALACLSRALNIQIRELGRNSEDVAKTLNRLGIFYRMHGDDKSAEAVCRDALAIREHLFGPEHPFTTAVVTNLLAVYEQSKQTVQASQLAQRLAGIKSQKHSGRTTARTEVFNVVFAIGMSLVAAGILFAVGLVSRYTSLFDGIRGSYAASRDQADEQRLARLGEVMRLFSNDTGHFPESISDGSGRNLLSWRVRILPLLGDKEKKLFEKFDITKPWDSEHNLRLIDQMPAIFQSETHSKIPTGRTVFVTPTGIGTIFKDLTRLPSGSRSKSVETNAVLLLRTTPEHSVIWTRPEDLEFDPQAPFRGVISPDGATLLFLGNGKTLRVGMTTDPDTLRNLFSPDTTPIK